MNLDEIQDETGLSNDDVKRATRALLEAQPPLIKGIGADQVTYPFRIVGVTERARVKVGQLAERRRTGRSHSRGA